MAIQDIKTLKSKFENGKEPRQEDFWDLIDSFYHKSTLIDQNNILGLTDKFQEINDKLSDIVYVRWYGAKGDGVTDDTASINQAAATSKPFIVDNGIYVFTGDNLENIDNLVIDNAIIVDAKRKQCIYVDKYSNKPIGLMHNYKEFTCDAPDYLPITNGNITTAPEAFPEKTAVNLAAYWYQDFGRESQRLAGNAGGWIGWYDWRWNFTKNTGDGVTTIGYDARRHPLLGYYRGDDAKVIDWQAYWLLKSGINSVIIQSNFTPASEWSDPANANYWIYNGIKNSKNFKKLKIVLWGSTGSGKPESEAQTRTDWNNILDWYINNPENVLTIDYLGKTYAVMFCWDTNQLTGTFDNYNGANKTLTFLEEKGAFLKDANWGWDGLCLLCRNAYYTFPTALRNNLLCVSADYSEQRVSQNTNEYSNYITHNNFASSKYLFEVSNVVLDHNSQYPHPSARTMTRSDKQLFALNLKTAINNVIKGSNPINLVTLYNVSEWAEGGQGLQPTVGHGFDFLDAIKESILGTEIRANIPKEAITYNPLYSAGLRKGLSSRTIYFIRPNYDDFNLTRSANLVIGEFIEGDEIVLISTGGRLRIKNINDVSLEAIYGTSDLILYTGDSATFRYDKANLKWVLLYVMRKPT